MYHEIIRSEDEAQDLDQYWSSLNCMGERDVRLIKRLEFPQDAESLRARISDPYTVAVPIPPTCFKEQFPQALTDGFLAWVGTLQAPLQAAYAPYQRERAALSALQQCWAQQNEVAAAFHQTQSSLRSLSHEHQQLTQNIDAATREITRLEGEQRELKQQEPQRGKYTEEEVMCEPIVSPAKHLPRTNKVEFKVNFRDEEHRPLSSVHATLNITGAE